MSSKSKIETVNITKTQIRHLEILATISETKNSLDGINDKLDMVEERTE